MTSRAQSPFTKKNSWFVKSNSERTQSFGSFKNSKSERKFSTINYITIPGPPLSLSTDEIPMYHITPIHSYFFNDQKIGSTLTKFEKNKKKFLCIIGGNDMKIQNTEVDHISLFLYNLGILFKKLTKKTNNR
jgi:hypothetical protein